MQTRASFPGGVNAPVRGLVAGAPVKHMDETGFRIGGTTQWLHVPCTVLLTFYRTCARRGSLFAGVAGIVVHDHWKPYYTLTPPKRDKSLATGRLKDSSGEHD